mgnify:CR=1 FL=1|tara:strand:+ start:23048 stop:23515 length:468 start_codon:yes stop_codon:yes gene_type:complete
MDTLHIPDLIRESAPRHRLSAFELIAREREPLPSHRVEGGNFRQWAVAVCDAEVKHRDADFARCERLLGLSFDRYAEPRCVLMGEFLHEAHAAAALHWLSYLQTHESERRTSWFHPKKWRDWKPEDRAAWLAKRRYLWRGFLSEVRAYQQTKGEG